MTDAAYRDLLTCCESALGAGKRSVTIARALAEAHRSGLRPPDDVIEAYLARLEDDQVQLHKLRDKLAEFRREQRGA
jgi:hypothetical protein